MLEERIWLIRLFEVSIHREISRIVSPGWLYFLSIIKYDDFIDAEDGSSTSNAPDELDFELEALGTKSS